MRANAVTVSASERVGGVAPAWSGRRNCCRKVPPTAEAVSKSSVVAAVVGWRLGEGGSRVGGESDDVRCVSARTDPGEGCATVRWRSFQDAEF